LLAQIIGTLFLIVVIFVTVMQFAKFMGLIKPEATVKDAFINDTEEIKTKKEQINDMENKLKTLRKEIQTTKDLTKLENMIKELEEEFKIETDNLKKLEQK